MKILICAFIEKNLCPHLAKLVTAGKAISATGEIDVLMVGHNIGSDIRSQGFEGVSKNLVADKDIYAHASAEEVTKLLLDISKNYDAILAPTTGTWKNILPRFSALCDVMMVSDVVDIIDSNTYKRPIYAGNAIATLENKQEKKIMTIRSSSFEASSSKTISDIQEVSQNNLAKSKAEFIEQIISLASRPDLSTAKIVVSGGRGVGSQENFKLIEDFADALGAAVGASRAAVDAGFIGNDVQVGQTGKIVAPEIYIAVGISGAIQHLAGMKESKIIIAINKDSEAPIFSVADYGIVGDLFDIVPGVIKALK